jgi:hypothetical protein
MPHWVQEAPQLILGHLCVNQLFCCIVLRTTRLSEFD